MPEVDSDDRHRMRCDHACATQQRSVTTQRQQRVEARRIVEPHSAVRDLVKLALIVKLKPQCRRELLQRLLAVGADKGRRAAEPSLELMVERMGFVKPEAGRLFGAAKPRGL